MVSSEFSSTLACPLLCAAILGCAFRHFPLTEVAGTANPADGGDAKVVGVSEKCRRFLCGEGGMRLCPGKMDARLVFFS